MSGAVDALDPEVPADWAGLGSPETYLGYERTESFASTGGAVPDEPHRYAAPPDLRRNHSALSGDWRWGTARPAGRARWLIAYQFRARDLNLVMGPPLQSRRRFRGSIDGQPPGPRTGPTPTGGQWRADRAAAAPAHPSACPDRRPPLRGRLPRPGAEAFAFTFG